MIIRPVALKWMKIALGIFCLMMLTSIAMDYRNANRPVNEFEIQPDQAQNGDIDDRVSGLASQEDYNGIIERPLFSITRTPPQSMTQVETGNNTPVIQTGNTPGNEEYKLSGVMIDSQNKLAFIRSSRDSITNKLSVGEKVDNWQLTEIHPHSVTLMRGTETRVLGLQVQKGPTKTTVTQPRQASTQSNENESPPVDVTTPQGESRALTANLETDSMTPQQIERMEQLRQRLSEFQALEGRSRAGSDIEADSLDQPSAPPVR